MGEAFKAGGSMDTASVSKSRDNKGPESKC